MGSLPDPSGKMSLPRLLGSGCDAGGNKRFVVNKREFSSRYCLEPFQSGSLAVACTRSTRRIDDMSLIFLIQKRQQGH
jgi:hypothetical protein